MKISAIYVFTHGAFLRKKLSIAHYDTKGKLGLSAQQIHVKSSRIY
jgi:hypothetical protein